MRVVVVGGGLAGTASAARLAKLGHEVVLFEARDRLGGAIGHVERDAFRWDSGPTRTLVPAVLRDLFRKTGRTLDRELDLVALDRPDRHVFADGTTLDLPVGARGAQVAAVDEALGHGLGERWAAYVSAYADTWETLRRELLERPWTPELAGREARALLGSRLSLERHARKTLRERRLCALATAPFALDGHDPRDVPAWAGVRAYLEQRFGVWTVPGGLGRLAGVLTARLATRGVEVHTGVDVLDLLLDGERVHGVRTAHGEETADAVVVACDPRRLPALAGYVARTTPAIPPAVAHLGLTGDVPDLPGETTWHDDPLLVVRTGGTAPEGGHAWTVLTRATEDPVALLARRGVDVRRQVVVRVDRSPRELVEDWHGSPLGVRWEGRRTLERRLGAVTPVAGAYSAGAHVGILGGIPDVGLSAARVAEVIGPA